MIGAPSAPPAIQLVRPDEDWSRLRDPALRAEAPAFKFIAVSANGSIFLSLGGEIRERMDSFDAPRFGLGARGDTYDLQRVMIHADLHLGSRVRVFAQLARDDAFGRNAPPGPSDVDRGDLANLFVDLTPDTARSVTLRIGRQDLIFNTTQRFVSVREGPNVRQSFDGARLTWRTRGLRLDAFATRPVLYKPGAFDNSSDGSQAFYGATVSAALGRLGTLEAYALELDRDRVKFQSTAGNERRRTFGLRWAGRLEAWDWDLEAAGQGGSIAGYAIRAWAIGAIAGYTVKTVWSPRFGVEVDAGSGDHDPKDGSVETFNPLFPKGAYFNETSLNSWANTIALHPSLTAQPTKSITLQVGAIARWREDPADAVYLQPYVALPQTLGNRAAYVGTAVQFDATWRATRHLTLQIEAVRQEAAGAIARAGGRSADFAMLITQVKF